MVFPVTAAAAPLLGLRFQEPPAAPAPAQSLHGCSVSGHAFSPMPYELTFTKALLGPDPEIYINDCRFGGDVIADLLLPVIRDRYSEVWSNQEDWGWFIWVRDGPVKHAIDIFCDDRTRGEYRLRLSSSRRKWFLWSEAETPEGARLRELVELKLTSWLGEGPRRKRV